MSTYFFEPALAKFKLPLPPTTNHSYTPAVIGDKPTFISKKEHKQFKQDAELLLNNQFQLRSRDEQVTFMQLMKDIQRSKAFLFLDVLFFLDNILSRDEDGGLKVVQDVICKHIGINDKYVLDAHPAKRKAHGNPRCEVTLYLANQENAQ